MTSAVLAICAVVLEFHAESITVNKWLGNWKLDRSKSHLIGPSISIKRTGHKYLFDFGAVSFTIGDDGADYPTVNSRSTSLKQTGARTWLRIHRIRGKEVDRSTIVISQDNRNMVIHTVSVDNGQDPRTSDERLTRTGQGHGLAGTWRSTTAGANVSEIISLGNEGRRGLRWGFPNEGQYYIVLPNGPPASDEGPRSVPGVTLLLKVLSATSMEWTESINGKPYMKGIDTLSDGGNVLQERSWPVLHPSEQQLAVYEREKD